MKQALVGLVLDHAPEPGLPAGSALHVDGKRVGRFCGMAYSPTCNAWVAMAYLGREYRSPGARRRFAAKDGASAFEARVVLLPFHAPESREARARRYYDEALDGFEQDGDDTDTETLTLLREAVVLDPDFEDAYEALGVALHRQGRTGEAIAIMQRLGTKSPDSVMVHTNLSIFYVAKGMIAEAEEEKARAAQLEVRRHLDKQQAAKAAAKEQAERRREAEEHLILFEEVLAIDPADPVAAMGLGNAYLQLDRPAEAVAVLETATRNRRDYSAAWLKLGQCHEQLGNAAAAVDAYRQGIAAAGRRGDLMPLCEMEHRIKTLGSR